MNMTKTTGWPEAERAKAEWDRVRQDPNVSDEEKARAQQAYAHAIENCHRELGMW